MSAAPSPGVYPGNPSLPREVREKILSTFRHTLNLYKEGKVDDCLIGCDFILKMDPRFAPARRLLDKVRNPAAAVDLVELEALVATTPTRQERVGAAEPDRLLVRALESYNARDFDAAIASANQVLAVLPGNQNAVEVLENAKRKKAVQPEFEGLRNRAVASLEAKRSADARYELARMKELDAEHPAVALLERRILAMSDETTPELGGMMDFDTPSGAPGSFGSGIEEPQIGFGESTLDRYPPPASAEPGPDGGLDSLSLESLSFDDRGSSAVVPPPVDPSGRNWSPLSDASASRPAAAAAPAAAPGSPHDFWTEEEPAAPEPAPEPPRGARPEPPIRPPLHAAPPPPAHGLPAEDSGPGELEVEGLLHQGNEAAAAGDRQSAIEIWSRIFLIDINNTEAVTRIERVRHEMADGNRRMSEDLKTGRERFEAGDYAGAREKFLEVLAIDNGDATARSYLDRIEQQGVSGDAAGARDLESEFEPEPALIEADRAAGSPAAKAARGSRPRKFRLSPPVIGVAAAFLVIVVVGFWYIRRQPSPVAAPPSASPVEKGGSLARANGFLAEGKIPETIAELRRISPTSPDHARAAQLLDSLGKQGGDAAPAGVNPDSGAAAPAPAAPAVDDSAKLRADAEQALAEKRYIDALKLFNRAAPAFAGDPAFTKSLAAASDRVTQLMPAVKLYNDGEYETAIPVFWRISQDDRGNQDARSYLLRAYFNQGVTQLQNGLYPKAKQSFEEGLALDPADSELARNRKFAERYVKGDLDLLGRIYVRHLSHRP